MKTTAKKKFLLCFQPINAMENRAPIKSYSTNNLPQRRSESNFVNNKDESSKLKKISSDDRFLIFNKVSSHKESNGCSSRTKAARKILKNMAKAVFFDTSLSKKGRKVVQDPWRSESNISAKTEKICVLTEAKSNRKQLEEEEEDEEDKWKKIKPTISSSDLSSSANLTLYSTSSLSSSSSSSTSSSCSSSWLPVPESRSSWITYSDKEKSFRLNLLDHHDHQKQSSNNNNKTRSSNYSCITGLILLLFSLFVLIFCGKICSILCTSTWFYFVSTSRRGSEVEEEDDGELPVMLKSPEEITVKGVQEKSNYGRFHGKKQQPSWSLRSTLNFMA